MKNILSVFAAILSILTSVGVFADESGRTNTEPTATSFAESRDQGIHYFRQKQYEQALLALEQAIGMPGGEEDFNVHYYLARVYYDDLIIENARPHVLRAIEIKMGSEDGDAKRAVALLERIDDFFGAVTLTQAEEQVGKVREGLVHLVVTRPLINRNKKDVFRKIRERFKRVPTGLPATIYLPFGEYTANLAPFEIKKGEPARAVTFLDARAGEASPHWGWYAGGAAALAALAVAVAIIFSSEDDPPRKRNVAIGGIRISPQP